MPLPGVSLRIVDDDGNDRPTGEVGEVLITGERPRREYFNQPEESERTWKEGWLKSGDLGYLDADGFLWISGRSKEMIIRGGHNIMPGEVESALFTHPAVADAAVDRHPPPGPGRGRGGMGRAAQRRHGVGRVTPRVPARAPGRLQGAPPLHLRRRPAA